MTVNIVKLFIGVYIIFLISALKHRLWVHVRTAHNLPVLSLTSHEIAAMSCTPNRFQASIVAMFYNYSSTHIWVLSRRGSYDETCFLNLFVLIVIVNSKFTYIVLNK